MRSYRTISTLPSELGGIFSVALSVGLRHPDVIWRSTLWSPDFPPLIQDQQRLSSRLRAGTIQGVRNFASKVLIMKLRKLKIMTLIIGLCGLLLMTYIFTSSLVPTTLAKQVGDTSRNFNDPELKNGEYIFLNIPAENYRKYLYIKDSKGDERVFQFYYWNNAFQLPEPTHQRPILTCKKLSLPDNKGSLKNIESISCESIDRRDATNYSWDFSGKNLGCYLPDLIQNEFTRKYGLISISKKSNIDTVKPELKRCDTN